MKAHRAKKRTLPVRTTAPISHTPYPIYTVWKKNRAARSTTAATTAAASATTTAATTASTTATASTATTTNMPVDRAIKIDDIAINDGDEIVTNKWVDEENEEIENFHRVMRNDDITTNDGDEIVTNKWVDEDKEYYIDTDDSDNNWKTSSLGPIENIDNSDH